MNGYGATCLVKTINNVSIKIRDGLLVDFAVERLVALIVELGRRAVEVTELLEGHGILSGHKEFPSVWRQVDHLSLKRWYKYPEPPLIHEANGWEMGRAVIAALN